MPLLNANGVPYPPTEAEQKAAIERMQKLLDDAKAAWGPDLKPSEVAMICVNLAVSFVYTGAFHEAPARFEALMSNIQAAMQQAYTVAAQQHKLQSALADAVNETRQ